MVKSFKLRGKVTFNPKTLNPKSFFRSTLTKYSDCMFSAMFSGRYAMETDESGCYFIDRDPTHFSVILNYLRDGDKVSLPESNKALLELKEEAEYYLLKPLIKLIDQYMYNKP